jgi:uncharacterized protein YjbJ (UPF0337 family)
MINENVAKGKWKEIKGGIQKAWGDLTEDELDKTEGDRTKISGMLQKKYGMKQEEAESKLNDIFGKFGSTEEDQSGEIRH